MKAFYIKSLFRLTKWVIKKYFSDGLTAIYGTGSHANRVIAYRWSFYNEEYKK